MSDTTFNVPPGLVAVTTYGQIQGPTAQAVWDARSFCEERGIKNLTWAMIPGGLVDKARNDACRTMLRENRGFVLFLDGDMTFPADAVFRLIQAAYATHPWADVVGGYCNLRGSGIPTTDTGTGTWEVIYPDSGVKEVMRTGGAFLLVKRHVCERMPDPWFAIRVPMRPIDALLEPDIFARTKFDGANPLRNTPEWAVLEQMAAQDPSLRGPFVPAEVGEDSGFCDKVKFHGMRIVVDTSIVTGHLTQTETTWRTLRETMAKRDKEQQHLVGLL